MDRSVDRNSGRAGLRYTFCLLTGGMWWKLSTFAAYGRLDLSAEGEGGDFNPVSIPLATPLHWANIGPLWAHQRPPARRPGLARHATLDTPLVMLFWTTSLSFFVGTVWFRPGPASYGRTTPRPGAVKLRQTRRPDRMHSRDPCRRGLYIPECARTFSSGRQDNPCRAL